MQPWLRLLVLLAFAGCSDTASVPASQKAKRPRRAPTVESAFTHLVAKDTEYYVDVPQQASPPDGRFKAGTQVRRIQASPQYWLVQDAAGNRVHVEPRNLTDLPPELKVAQASNQFAVDLYLQLADSEPGNVFFSPISISTSLAMVHAGAGGETKTEIAKSLHLAFPEDDVHAGFADLAENFQTAGEAELYAANRLWGQEGYSFNAEFLELTSDKYGAELGQVDFARPAEASRQISSWIEQQTRSRIRGSALSLRADTILVLTSAVYFKARWFNEFGPRATRKAPFHLDKRRQTTVPLMTQLSGFAYRKVDGVQILELAYRLQERPYEKGPFSMVLFLPEERDGLDDLEAKLSLHTLDNWLTGLRNELVKVVIPKFTLETQMDMNAPLASLGVTRAFRPGDADFSGISGREPGKDPLYITSAVHKTMLDVNEAGTEAAATTEWAVGASDEPILFQADHPFLFLIRDNRTGVFLFLGRFVTPG
ncbi:MAG: serpin family protein [Pirellulales bacterium]